MDWRLTDAECRMIVKEAIAKGYLAEKCLGGCGKLYDECGGCPCGSGIGWHPRLSVAQKVDMPSTDKRFV